MNLELPFDAPNVEPTSHFTDREINLLADAIVRYQRWQAYQLQCKEAAKYKRRVRRKKEETEGESKCD